MSRPIREPEIASPRLGGARNDEGSGFLLVIYQIFFVLGGIIYLGVRFLRRKPTSGLRQRLGWYSSRLRESLGKLNRPIWIHLVSVGEVLAARPLIEELRRRLPDQHWVVTTVTPTGHQVAKALLRGEQDQLLYLPWDLTPIVRRVVRRVNPSLFIAFETELWPVLFHQLEARAVPIIVANGRISPGALRRYLWIRPFMERLLAKVSIFLIQSLPDARRYAAIGAPKDRIVMTGNLKWDLESSEGASPSAGREIRQILQIPEPAFLWVAGSTHAGEEKSLIQIYGRLKERYPALRFLIAPRHPERIAQVEQEVAQAGYSSIRRTQLRSAESKMASGTEDGESIILLDTLGELVSVYQASDLVFVGGSLVPKGGHNLVEPAAAARPILTGPHLHNFEAMAESLLVSGGMVMVKSSEELEQWVQRLMEDPHARRKLGQRAWRVIQEHRGATAKTADFILQYVRHCEPRRGEVRHTSSANPSEQIRRVFWRTIPERA